MRRHPFIIRGFALAVLLAFTLHALIPVGYMPDFSGGHGPFALTICDGVDHQTMSAAEHAHMHHHEGGQHDGAHAPCPYSVGAVYASATFDVPLPVAPVYLRQPEAVLSTSAPYKIPAFANASPRSPPFFS